MQVGSEYLNERLVRRSERALLVAVADERESAGRGYKRAELVGKRGLADARLTDDQN
jgi:hypothetical protein